MTATNHALTGAIIGACIANPIIALSVAFVSHFVLDAVPHFDPPGEESIYLKSSSFVRQLSLDATLCFLLVVLLFFHGASNWFSMSLSAFVATTPDLMWVSSFLRARNGQKQKPINDWPRRFHAVVQWKTGPKLWWVEMLYFTGAATLLWKILS